MNKKQTVRVSICECGHTGDTVGTQHAKRFAEGHGPCLVKGCKCVQFTWVKFAMVENKKETDRHGTE